MNYTPFSDSHGHIFGQSNSVNTVPASISTSTCTCGTMTQLLQSIAIDTVHKLPPQSIIFKTINEEKDKSIPIITNVEQLRIGKVYRFTFDNKKVIKTICLDSDIFNFEFAFYIAYAKLLYGNELNSIGIEKKANELMGYKKYNKLVKQGIKLFNDTKKYKEKLEKEEKERKEIKHRQAEKKVKKKARKRQARIDEMAEAFKKANK